MAEQLLLFANELRTRARDILVRAANTEDLEAEEMMHVIAAGYQRLGAAGRPTRSPGSNGGVARSRTGGYHQY